MKQLVVQCRNTYLPADISLNERDIADLEMYMLGAFHPLQGYNTMEEFCSIIKDAKLPNGTVWPMPFVLAVPTECLSETRKDDMIDGDIWMQLRDMLGTILARVKVFDCYRANLEMYAEYLLGTTDIRHPYMSYLIANHKDTVYVGGEIVVVNQIMRFDFCSFRKTTHETRKMIKDNAFDAVIGFQTRNPMHRSHFELTCQAVKCVQSDILATLGTSNCATSTKVHLLLTPSCGPTQDGDINSTTRIRCYKKLLPYYKQLYDIDVSLVILPLAMRMAGPKEALWHALIRKNFGCTHFIVGRDHAGPSTRKIDGSPFYEPYAAHDYLTSFKDKLGITLILSTNMVYVGDNIHSYLPEALVPKTASVHQISGTEFRQLLQNRKPIPEWYSFHPIILELQAVYKEHHKQGFCMYFTGLPCSGKSTLASAVAARLRERENETRNVSILDADIVRSHLSRGLGFSKEDRSINVQRIGYVASLITHHHGIALVANIAPYRKDRALNRACITSMGGGYIEVYVSTPLSICQSRDVKQHYKKARLGVLKQFTGVDDPYEIPVAPELTIDSSSNIVGQVDSLITYLEENKWIQ